MNSSFADFFASGFNLLQNIQYMMVEKDLIISALLAEIAKKKIAIEEDERRLNESLSNQTKSSVGDKYETTRSMLHQELDKIKIRKGVLIDYKRIVDQISHEISTEVTFGAVVLTSIGTFLWGHPW